MSNIVILHDLPANPNNIDGPTIKEQNLQKKHNIPIDTLVEIKYDTWFGNGACSKVHARLWVIAHNRDCDGTSLYTLADKTRYTLCLLDVNFNSDNWVFEAKKWCDIFTSGHDEESLKVIKITPDIKIGHDALKWKEDEL